MSETTQAQRDNADGARVPDYYKHGANEYRRGYEDGERVGFERGYKKAGDASKTDLDRMLKACISAAEDVIDPARAPRPIPFHNGRPA